MPHRTDKRKTQGGQSVLRLVCSEIYLSCSRSTISNRFGICYGAESQLGKFQPSFDVSEQVELRKV